ncbi:hypothetical protein L9F63_009231, partial [Diploptera punctata]
VLMDEVLDPKFRGAMICGVLTSICAGITVISCSGMFLDWRSASGMGAVLAFISLILCIFLPESPMWLLRKNQMKRAEGVFKYLWGSGNELQ